MTDEFVKLLDQGCANLGIELSKQQKEQFFKYYEMLIEKSEKMETDILKCLLVLPDILHFFYRRWMKTGDSFQMELENSMEQGLKEIEAMLNITEEKAA